MDIVKLMTIAIIVLIVSAMAYGIFKLKPAPECIGANEKANKYMSLRVGDIWSDTLLCCRIKLVEEDTKYKKYMYGVVTPVYITVENNGVVAVWTKSHN